VNSAWEEAVCESCGRIFKYKPSATRGRFCSFECFRKRARPIIAETRRSHPGLNQRVENDDLLAAWKKLKSGVYATMTEMLTVLGYSSHAPMCRIRKMVSPEEYQKVVANARKVAGARAGISVRKINSDAYADIVAAYQEDGKTQQEIAEEYGVARGTIKKILVEQGVDTKKVPATRMARRRLSARSEKAWRLAEMDVAEYLGGEANPSPWGVDVFAGECDVEVKAWNRIPAWFLDSMSDAEANCERPDQLAIVVLHGNGMRHDDDLVVMRLREFRDRFVEEA